MAAMGFPVSYGGPGSSAFTLALGLPKDRVDLLFVQLFEFSCTGF